MNVKISKNEFLFVWDFYYIYLVWGEKWLDNFKSMKYIHISRDGFFQIELTRTFKYKKTRKYNVHDSLTKVASISRRIKKFTIAKKSVVFSNKGNTLYNKLNSKIFTRKRHGLHLISYEILL